MWPVGDRGFSKGNVTSGPAELSDAITEVLDGCGGYRSIFGGRKPSVWGVVPEEEANGATQKS